MEKKATVVNLVALSNQTLLPIHQLALPDLGSNMMIHNNPRKASFCIPPRQKNINTSKKV